MASLLIRGLDDSVKAALRVRAAHKGRSMEAEARLILSLEMKKAGLAGKEANQEPTKKDGSESK